MGSVWRYISGPSGAETVCISGRGTVNTQQGSLNLREIFYSAAIAHKH